MNLYNSIMLIKNGRQRRMDSCCRYILSSRMHEITSPYWRPRSLWMVCGHWYCFGQMTSCRTLHAVNQTSGLGHFRSSWCRLVLPYPSVMLLIHLWIIEVIQNGLSISNAHDPPFSCITGHKCQHSKYWSRCCASGVGTLNRTDCLIRL